MNKSTRRQAAFSWEKYQSATPHRKEKRYQRLKNDRSVYQTSRIREETYGALFYKGKSVIFGQWKLKQMVQSEAIK